MNIAHSVGSGTLVTGYQVRQDTKAETKVCDAVTVPEVFTPEECRKIIEIGLAQDVTKGLGISGGKDVVVRDRNCTLSWVGRAGSTEWIFDRLDKVLTVIGAGVFGFSLAPSHHFQFTIYKRFQFYNWHFDNPAKGDKRKVAMVVNLCDPKAYLGGALKIKCYEWKDRGKAREQGSATLFPCYLLHKACPVWRGTRYSLVVWGRE